jgi:hypothetical protein
VRSQAVASEGLSWPSTSMAMSESLIAEMTEKDSGSKEWKVSSAGGGAE